RAVHLREQPLAFGELISVLFILAPLLLAKLRRRLACDQGVERYLRRREIGVRWRFELAALAMAGGERQEEQRGKAISAGRTHTAFRLSRSSAADRSPHSRSRAQLSDRARRAHRTRSHPTSRPRP